MAWVYLGIAGMLEIGWALGLKYSEGFTKPVASVATIAMMIGSFLLLSQAVKTLPLGTAYAIWTGIGAVGTALAGMWLLGEPRDVTRLVCIGRIVAGIVGLKVVSPAH